MIVNDRVRTAEPERRQLRENLAFVRNARPEDVIEGGDAIGGDEDQRVPTVEQVSNFSLSMRRETVQSCFEQRRGERQTSVLFPHWIAEDCPERIDESRERGILPTDFQAGNRTQLHWSSLARSLIYCRVLLKDTF